MSTLDDLHVLVRAADTGSLSAAARTLDISPAAASLALKRLESRLGARLFARSTRQQRLTVEGERYLEAARVALAALEEGERAIRGGQGGLAGVLQLAAPSDFGRSVLLGWLDELREMHPHLQLHLLLNDRANDLFREQVDVALRFGVPVDSSLVALPVLEAHHRVLCASPAYLARRGVPASPEALAEHQAIIYQRHGRPYDLWRFTRGTRVCEVKVKGDYRCDDGEVARRWALAGHGIVYKAWLDVVSDVRAGRLCQVLEDWQGEHAPVYLMCPHRVQVSERVRIVQAFLRERCAALVSGHAHG
ncbi:LysR family transcriptional regulator [Pseudomonas fontis]|uniref:LysR family transcriptional regulator n=1 Tax=Pseudomonas fontis TaxID=2942633 RepID=A0ABT5NVC5_9PSED|nr:LysR family transcriptional regulator [Pseudomonas fontis]MDD0974123.1 LysR family transcriptional regulator [Pseudomonas fontis]MDD0992130.1 LysR family transcriptional regulator [Pseudomonas fontis]